MASNAVLIPLADQSIKILSIKQDLPTPGAPVIAIEDQDSLLELENNDGNSALI
jgi:hypothetical protein